MEVYKIEKPNITKMIFEKAIEHGSELVDLQKFVAATTHPEYLYWDSVKFRPRPEQLSAEEFWAIIKFFRQRGASRVRTAVRTEAGEYFTWQLLPRLQQFLHEVDMQLGGTLATSSMVDTKERRRYISRGIIEEAIASSQLEGANTTRKAAKQMIIEKRPPKTRSEQMILNNYEAMIAIEDELKESELDRNLLFSLHTTLTKETMDPRDMGRLRRDSDEIVVQSDTQAIIYHVPPSQKFLDKELVKLLDYANDKVSDGEFVHPVLKAIILHFWVGYLHPFVDGNGRLARALFYWYLLRKDYWAFSFLPLSRVIKNSPAQYRNAYVYSEQDDCDLTYFVDYNVRKIIQAKREFDEHVARKRTESSHMMEIARTKFHLNDRQIQLVRYLYKNAGASTTIETHATIYEISRMTARKDLTQLQKKGFLSSRKSGREVPYQATPKVASLFGKSGSTPRLRHI